MRLEYKILSGENSQELERFVNSLIEQGWTPLGGVAVYQSPAGGIFHQAMVKTNPHNYSFSVVDAQVIPLNESDYKTESSTNFTWGNGVTVEAWK